MKLPDFFRLILLSMIWGSSYLLLRIVAPVIGISLAIGGRLLLAALVLLLFAGMSRQFPALRDRWKAYLVLGALNLAIPFVLITYSVVHLNASYGAILNATTPLFTLIAARIWLKEQLTLNKITGLLISIAGIVIIVGGGSLPQSESFWLGILAGLLASCSYGLASVYTKKKFTGTNPMQTASGQLLTAAALMFPFLLMNFKPVIFSQAILWPLLFIAIVSTAIAYTIYFKLVNNAGSVNASLVTILVPVFSLLWAYIFLHEKISLSMLEGLLMVFIGLCLVLIKMKWTSIFSLKFIKIKNN